jgi:thioredoxin-like negative regulator of GroEL
MYWLFGAAPTLIRGAHSLGDTSGRLGLFRQAQVEYLSGNWCGAERLLQQLLGTDETDADVRLMLATLYRRIRRWDAARRQLALVTTYDQRGKWRLEIARERILLAQETAKQKLALTRSRADGSDGRISGAA